MEPVKLIYGGVTVLDRADVDTDQIIPKQFLKRVERTGFGEFLFYDWAQGGRLGPAGQPDPRHRPELRLRLQPRARPVGAQDYGFKAVVAPLVRATSSSPTARRSGCCRSCCPEEDVRALMQAGEARGRPRGARGPLRRPRGAVRDRRRDPPPAAQRARRHRAHAAAGRRDRGLRARPRALGPGDYRLVEDGLTGAARGCRFAPRWPTPQRRPRRWNASPDPRPRPGGRGSP